MKTTLNKLIKAYTKAQKEITEFKDGFVYFCIVHSYGQHYGDHVNNAFMAEERSKEYPSGDNGFIDIHTNNPDFKVTENWGGIRIIFNKDITEKHYLGHDDYTPCL